MVPARSARLINAPVLGFTKDDMKRVLTLIFAVLAMRFPCAGSETNTITDATAARVKQKLVAFEGNKISLDEATGYPDDLSQKPPAETEA